MGMLENLYGIIGFGTFLLLLIAGTLGAGFFTLPLWMWSAFSFAIIWVAGIPRFMLVVIALVLLIFNLPLLRRRLVSTHVMRLMQKMKILPVISETEKVALEAGTTWIDGELFSGNPNFHSVLQEPYPQLSQREWDFLNGPCEEICRKTDNDRAYEEKDLSSEVWAYIRKNKFWGLVIPEEYGGLGFSALGHGEVISKLSSCSIPLAITVMVPNSLGPGELILHYGTQKQKDYYLPRLAGGDEIPCFALTEAEAGSDAGSIQSSAVVFRGEDGQLYLRVNWSKRYITLGAVATLIGLAVKVFDPESLLGKGKELGISCVLVPSTAEGVLLGRRHDPLGVPFINSPISGKNVVVAIEQVIGGEAGIGSGWKMLMECLAAGRGISIPSQTVGNGRFGVRATGAYIQVRKQFGVSISQFEGIADAFARVCGFSYIIEACRQFTVGAVDSGFKPAVVSAIAKYHSTELGRVMVNDCMDILGGAGISKGPRNLVARSYEAAPIAVTVEGANILTRTMIIFGQGAIRCHPYAYKQVVAVENEDLRSFDFAFFGHIGHVVRNASRAILLSLSRGRFATVPNIPFSPYLKRLAWVSASFGFFADVAMATLGGKLKFKEKITARYGDILSWMFLITAVIRRYEAEGRNPNHEPLVHYAVRHGFNEIQKAFEGIFANLDIPVVGWVFKYPLSWWARLNTVAMDIGDDTCMEAAACLMAPGALRDGLTQPVFLGNEALERLEKAFLLSVEADAVYKNISRAVRKGKLAKGRPAQLIDRAVDAGIITQEQAVMLRTAEEAGRDAIQVDDFAFVSKAV